MPPKGVTRLHRGRGAVAIVTFASKPVTLGWKTRSRPSPLEYAGSSTPVTLPPRSVSLDVVGS